MSFFWTEVKPNILYVFTKYIPHLTFQLIEKRKSILSSTQSSKSLAVKKQKSTKKATARQRSAFSMIQNFGQSQSTSSSLSTQGSLSLKSQQFEIAATKAPSSLQSQPSVKGSSQTSTKTASQSASKLQPHSSENRMTDSQLRSKLNVSVGGGVIKGFPTVRKRPLKYRYLSRIIEKFSLFWDRREEVYDLIIVGLVGTLMMIE